MLRIGASLLSPYDSREVSTTSPYNSVNQLNTARSFIWNNTTKARCTVDTASHFSLEIFVMAVSVGIDVSKDKRSCFIVFAEVFLPLGGISVAGKTMLDQSSFR